MSEGTGVVANEACSWVVAHRCSRCGKPAHIQDFKGVAFTFVRRCSKCGQDGHVLRDCPHRTEQDADISIRRWNAYDCCDHCGEAGHYAPDSPYELRRSWRGFGGGGGDGALRCFRCGEELEPYRCSPVVLVPWCTKCHKDGHMLRHCPDRTDEDGDFRAFCGDNACGTCEQPSHFTPNCPVASFKYK